MIFLSPGDTFGVLALVFVAITALIMAARRMVLKRVRNLNLLRRVHILASTLAGLFLILHIAYFIGYPFDNGIVLGYISTALALLVWLTGTAFLERFRDSLFFHSTMTLGVVSLVLLHSAVSGVNLPFLLSGGIITAVVITMIVSTTRHVERIG
ncbi:MAG: hypothetical protein OK422_02215 [Thaumarchaeota archaeon]|nr:hypothetical protein [Nitrososphaerota archaeon]